MRSGIECSNVTPLKLASFIWKAQGTLHFLAYFGHTKEKHAADACFAESVTGFNYPHG